MQTAFINFATPPLVWLENEKAEVGFIVDKALNFAPVKWIREKAARYSDLLQSIETLALNTLFLVSLIVPGVPTFLTQGTLVILSYTGVKGLPYWYDEFSKLCEDTQVAYKADMKLLACVTGIKALMTFSNMGLSIGGFAAAVAGLAGFVAAQGFIYSALMPIGIATIVVSVALLFAYIAISKKALAEVEEMKGFQLTPLIRASISKDILCELEKSLKRAESDEDLEILRKLVQETLENDLKYVQAANISLQMIGFALMLVQKYFKPISIVSASINEFYSVGWTCKILGEKIYEYIQRLRYQDVARAA